MLSRFLPVSSDSAMNFAMNFLKRLVFMRPVCECSANVIPFQSNFLEKFKTPGNKFSGVFLFTFFKVDENLI